MNAEGYCYPSQAELARALGCSRQMANDRIKSLSQFRFQDKPVLLVERENRTGQGTWGRNGYRILPIANLGIFDQPLSNQSDGRKKNRPKQADTTHASNAEGTMSRDLDMVQTSTVSSPTGTVELDTNKNQEVNKNQSSNIRRTTPSKSEHESEPRNTPREGQRDNRQTMHYDEDRQVILEFVSDFARELGDNAPLKSSTTRAYRLFKRSSLTRNEFIDAMYQARAVTKERTAAIRGSSTSESMRIQKNKIAYWFACLEALLEDWHDLTIT